MASAWKTSVYAPMEKVPKVKVVLILEPNDANPAVLALNWLMELATTNNAAVTMALERLVQTAPKMACQIVLDVLRDIT